MYQSFLCTLFSLFLDTNLFSTRILDDGSPLSSVYCHPRLDSTSQTSTNACLCATTTSSAHFRYTRYVKSFIMSALSIPTQSQPTRSLQIGKYHPHPARRPITLPTSPLELAIAPPLSMILTYSDSCQLIAIMAAWMHAYETNRDVQKTYMVMPRRGGGKESYCARRELEDMWYATW